MIRRLISRALLVAPLCVGTTINASAADPDTAHARASDKPHAAVLRDKTWIHGSPDCESNVDPAIEVFRYDQSSYILRQNKCLSFEAPFIYVLLGDEKVFVLDTGATASALEFPLFETVRSLMPQRQGGRPKLLVVHSHGHSDHYGGDSQFAGKPNVTVVEPNSASVRSFFGFDAWPDGEAEIELGNRTLTVIPTPGHQEEAIAVYDPHTGWLLTGDTLYPGYIYVKHWEDYKQSIARLVSLAESRDVSAVLGAHIEMTTQPGEHYPIGATYQPAESSLALSRDTLVALHTALQRSTEEQEIVLDELIVVPMNGLQTVISDIARWLLRW